MSGRFYPADRTELEGVVRELLAEAFASSPRTCRAALVPHAALDYAGPTAARVFARLAPPRLTVVLAPNHTGVCRAEGGASLWERGAFRTPLGDTPVDERFADALLARCPLVAVDRAAHADEHAIEVLLPFLRMRRADAAIVPLVLAWDAWDAARELGETLAALIGEWPEPVLLLASSDLTHYEPAPASEAKDARALDAVRSLDGAELLRRCRDEGITMCGRAAAAAMLVAARALGASAAEVVDYRHSGWVTGDDRAVVGYGGVVIG